MVLVSNAIRETSRGSNISIPGVTMSIQVGDGNRQMFPLLDEDTFDTVFCDVISNADLGCVPTGSIDPSNLPDSVELARKRLSTERCESTRDFSDSESASYGSASASTESGSSSIDSIGTMSVSLGSSDTMTSFMNTTSDVSDDSVASLLVPDEDAGLSLTAPTVPSMSLTSSVVIGWHSTSSEKWRKDPVLYDVQEIRLEPGQSYVVQCVRSRTYMSERMVRDMFGDYVVAYFAAFPFGVLKAEQALRVGMAAREV